MIAAAQDSSLLSAFADAAYFVICTDKSVVQEQAKPCLGAAQHVFNNSQVQQNSSGAGRYSINFTHIQGRHVQACMQPCNARLVSFMEVAAKYLTAMRT